MTPGRATKMEPGPRQQKWNQDHATAVQELRQDTTTMNDNITTMMRFWNNG